MYLDQTSTESLVSANVLKNFENPNEPILNKDPNSHKVSDWYSIFPVENTELIYGKWEDKIIWDSEAVDKLPSPEVFKLDPNDENLVLALPEDSVQEVAIEDAAPKKEYRSKSRYISKKMLLQEQAEQEVNFYADLFTLGLPNRHLAHVFLLSLEKVLAFLKNSVFETYLNLRVSLEELCFKFMKYILNLGTVDSTAAERPV